MILVDTSVWIGFFRRAAAVPRLPALLESGEVVMHPWVLGELALGQRGEAWGRLLADLRLLPGVAVVADAEAMAFVEARGLGGKGIGWVAAQLLAAALTQGCALWTTDKHLARAAKGVGVSLL